MKAGILILGLLLAGSAAAQPWAKGDALPALDLEDQHGTPHRLDEGVRHVLFTREMGAGRLLKQALEDEGATRLQRAGAVYVADLSGMPRFARTWFAMRGLRRRPYPVLVDVDGQKTERIPSEKGSITWLALDGLRITGVRYLGSVEEIQAALEP